MLEDAIGVAAIGAIITTSGTSDKVAVTNDASGTKPKYVRIAATAAAYVKLGIGTSITAAAGAMLVQPGDAVVVKLSHNTHVAAIQVTAAGVVQITPLEDQ